MCLSTVAFYSLCSLLPGAALSGWLLCSLASKENTMKSRIPIFFCLLFLVVCCGGRSSMKRKAYQSLDTVIQLYESGANPDDPDLLAPALAYFPSTGDAVKNGQLWYYSGLISYFQGEYDKAIVSYEKALQQTRISGDRHLEGLVCRAMSDTYNQTYNIREDTLYMRKAWLAFDSVEDSLYRAEVALRLAAAYMNARKWDDADRLLQEFLPICNRNRALFGIGKTIYASYLLNAPSGDPELALQCLLEAEEAGFPMSDSKKCDLGYALYLTGRKDRAVRLWDSLARLHPEGLLQLQYRQYNRYSLEGKLAEALFLLEGSAARQDSLLRTQASEAVSQAQRDYQEAVAESEKLAAVHERARKRATWVFSVLIVALLLLTGWVIWQEQRERLDTVRSALEESERLAKRLAEAEHRHINKIESLQRSVRNREATLEEIRSDYLEMFRDGYRRLGQLFEDKQFAETQVMTESVLYRRVCDALKDIDGDSKGFQRLQGFIEDHLGSPIASLRQDIPSLSEKEIRLFCYLVIGYDAPLIAALMGVAKDRTIHDWKNRLVTKIRRLPPSKAKRYLDLIR